MAVAVAVAMAVAVDYSTMIDCSFSDGLGALAHLLADYIVICALEELLSARHSCYGASESDIDLD